MDLLEESIDDPISHWYYECKFREISKAILRYKKNFKTLSDIGSGSAVFSKELSKKFKGVNFNLIDINYSPAQISKSTINMRYTKEVKPADVFLLTDVLEHIEQPKEFFQELCSVGKDDDLIVITVPAFMQLWSGHDVFLKHFRRYTKKSLLVEVQESPIEILNVKYLYQTLFLPAYVYRKIFGSKNSSQLKNHRITERLIKLLLRIESNFELNLPFGVSILLIARIKHT
jgi:2-polyprenyl-3-methyl-5-hydroxy-6-metoxy-1,4-benzoquinol methylase